MIRAEGQIESIYFFLSLITLVKKRKALNSSEIHVGLPKGVSGLRRHDVAPEGQTPAQSMQASKCQVPPCQSLQAKEWERPLIHSYYYVG